MRDAGVSYVSNESGHHNLKADNSIWTPSLWGLRGIEDLGAGCKAVFKPASQFSVNDGKGIPKPSADFNRQATVGLSKSGDGRAIGSLSFVLAQLEVDERGVSHLVHLLRSLMRERTATKIGYQDWRLRCQS